MDRAPPPVPAAVAPLNSPVVDDAAGPARVPAVVSPASARAPGPATATAPIRSTEARIPRLAELPESTRQALPKLAISGSIYSEDASARFVMINGDVVREGAVLAPDLVLEQIRPRELVMRFRGQRYLQPV
jgi:general secretion pathway protein B